MAKYDKKMTERILSLIREDTYTIREICRQVRICPATLYRWIDTHEDFARAIEEAHEERRQFFAQEAKKSLLKKIQGYDVTETKVVTVPAKGDETKPRVKEQITTKKHIAPDTAAIIFTLTNTDPKNWRNRHSTELTGKDGTDLFKTLSDEDLDAEIRGLQDKMRGGKRGEPIAIEALEDETI